MQSMNVAATGEGLHLTGGAGPERLRAASALRLVYGDSVRPISGGYRLPVEAAADLLTLLASSDSTWDVASRRHAEDQTAVREAQRSAALEVADAIADPGPGLASIALGAELDRHQMEAAAAIATPSLHGLALFDEQGTGKTFSALAGFALLKRQGLVERALVVAPKSVLGAWAKDASVLLPDLVVRTVDGTAKQRVGAILSKHDLLLANYEALVAHEGLLVASLSGTPRRYFLIIDESYFAKNPGTRRAQALAAIRPYCSRAIVLCGTPAPNRPWDIVNQVDLADGGLAFHGLSRPNSIEQERLSVAEGLAHAVYLRRLKTEVLPDLPPQQFYKVPVEMAPSQAGLYEGAARELVMEVRSISDDVFRRQLMGYLARRSALLRICSHPGSVDPMYSEIPGKILALDRLVAEIVEQQGEKIVIWSWYRYSLDFIADRYRPFGVVRIDGTSGSAASRSLAIDQFQLDPSVRIFVGNAAAAGAGITLTAARTAIYESFSNQAAHYLQSLDRIHRRGQEAEVRYAVLVCRGTIEEGEYARLLDKQRDARALMRDAYEEPPSRTLFLEELERELEICTS